MRFRKPVRCYCGKDVPERELEAHIATHPPRDSFPMKTKAPPSVATPNSPATGGSLPKPSPQPVDALGRAPGSDRPDVSPKSSGPLVAQHQDIKLDPDAVRELLWTLRGRGYSTETLAKIARVTPRTIRRWLAIPALSESDDQP